MRGICGLHGTIFGEPERQSGNSKQIGVWGERKNMSNILLIGMPGAGKSTVGVVLAKTLGCQFIDTDILLIKKLGMTLQSYIDTRGITAFLEEEALLGQEIECSDTVIATGGSMVLSEAAMAHLAKDALTIFIDTPLPELKRRLGNIRTRGVTLGPGETIDELYERRRPFYEKYAAVTVPANRRADMQLEELVEEIAGHAGATRA